MMIIVVGNIFLKDSCIVVVGNSGLKIVDFVVFM